jgi:putative acyl-CoA dehydrogenase
VSALIAEIERGRGADARLDRVIDELARDLADATDVETRARRTVETAALALQASLLVRYAPVAVADAFCAARLGERPGLTFGALPAGTDTATLIARARPQVD